MSRQNWEQGGSDMNRLVHLFIVMLFVMGIVGYQQIKAIKPEEKITQIQTVLEKNGAHIQEWSLLAKEESDAVSDIHTFQKLLGRLKTQMDGADWYVENAEQGMKATAIKKFSNRQERLVVTWTNAHTTHKTFIIYEVKGKKWDEGIVAKMDKIFSQKPTIYTCVRAVWGDKIEGVLQNKATKILKDLEAKPIETLQERAFVTVSAYTGKWNDALSINKEKMNVQVALRTVGDKTTVVVGTPIITSEY